MWHRRPEGNPTRHPIAIHLALNPLDLPGSALALQIANRLLTHNTWAPPRLRRFSGKVVELRVTELAVRLRVTEAGTMAPAPEGSPDVTIRLKSADLPFVVLRRRIDARQVDIDGDAMLAAELSTILGHLEFDKEEWLSRLTGDIVAHRVGRSIDAAAAWPADVMRRFLANLGEFLTEEAHWLPPQHGLASFTADVDTLRDDVSRLEKRIERLTARKPI